MHRPYLQQTRRHITIKLSTRFASLIGIERSAAQVRDRGQRIAGSKSMYSYTSIPCAQLYVAHFPTSLEAAPKVVCKTRESAARQMRLRTCNNFASLATNARDNVPYNLSTGRLGSL